MKLWLSVVSVLMMWLLTVQQPIMAQDNAQPCPYRLSLSDQRLFTQAVTDYQKGHYQSAVASLRKVSAKNPKAADVWFYLGMSAVALDNNPAAIRRYFTKLIDLCPDYPNALAHYYRAVVFYTDEQYLDAVAELNRYFEITNHNSIPEYVAVYQEASSYLHWSNFLAEAYQNPVPYNPVVMRGISGVRDEILPYLTFDGQYAYYLRHVPQRKETTIYAKMDEKLAPRLCVSRWKDTAFSPGQELPYPFNQGDPEGGVCLTADNQTLFFSSAKKGGNFDIYSVSCSNGTWGDLVPLGKNVNDAKYWDSQPTVSPDGQYLYFSSNRPGGQGGMDIWFCRRLANGDWSRAENAGPAINTAGNEKCPFLCADGKTLFFASDGWQGFGGYDMYRINLMDTYMQMPVNLGHPINSEADDICFGVTSDGKRSYLSTKNADLSGVGGYDIFAFDLYPDVRPEGMRLIQVVGAPAGASVCLSRYGADEARYPVAAGLPSTPIFISNVEDNVIAVVADSCVPAVAVVKHGNVSHTQGVTLSPQPIRKGGSYSLGFSPVDNKGSVTELGKNALGYYVRFLQNNPMVHFCIESRSATEAKAVYDYLLQQKLRAERLEYKSGTAVGSLQFTITQVR